MIECEVTATCEGCKKQFEGDCLITWCPQCNEKAYDEGIKEALIERHNRAPWEDWDSYQGFKDDEDKKIYLAGVKQGYEHALFWIADHFGLTNFFEETFWKDKK